MALAAPDFADVAAANMRIRPLAYRTPLLENQRVNDLLGGRLFEAYSEDPLLSGRLAAAYIRGIQRYGVGACVKHYVANESETERLRAEDEVEQDKRVLVECHQSCRVCQDPSEHDERLHQEIPGAPQESCDRLRELPERARPEGRSKVSMGRVNP